MIQRSILLFTFTLLTLFSKSQNVSGTDAFEVAQSFMSKKGVVLVNDMTNTRGDGSYSVFKGKDGKGFAIVVNGSVFGYSVDGMSGDMPDELREMLESYSSQVTTTRSADPDDWFTPRNVAPIQPLVTTHWNHCSPYNDLIPEKTGICATLAYAQLMHYYRASGCFTDLYNSYEDVTLPPTTFNHDLILDEYDNTSSEESRNEVAKLVRYCRYGFSSGSNTEEAFNLKWSDYSKTSWEKEFLGKGRLEGMVYNTSEFLDSCLETGNPVINMGCREDGVGHLSIIDGRDSEGRYHFNLGWGGLYDGYYEIANSIDDYRSASYYDVRLFVLLKVNGWTPKGDLNGDGNIDSADIKEIENYIMGNPSPNFDVKKADINNDGVVNVADMVIILNRIKKNSDEDDKSGNYLTFVAEETCGFHFTGTTGNNRLYWSIDGGTTWFEQGSDHPDTGQYPTPIGLSAGQKIMWKGNLTPSTTYPNFGICTFSSSGRFSVEGNVMSLLYGDDFADKTDLTGKEYAFYGLFSGCTGLTSAEHLCLPATTLANFCYSSMFYGCTSLTTAPSLPATTLADWCYQYMFYSCTSLTTAPSLPATTLTKCCYSSMFQGCTTLTTAPQLTSVTLAEWCYDSMFLGCTSLTIAPSLPATALTRNCYCQMFQDCTSLTTAPSLPATTLASYCYSNMFQGCTSLTTAPELPATTLAEECYKAMFFGCTSLTTAPELPATTLTDMCYGFMFYDCTSLKYIKCLATDISATDCTLQWVSGVASSGTFVKASSMTSWTTGNDGIPSNWTIQDETTPGNDRYLTFVAEEGGTFKFYGYGSVNYSLDNGTTWNTLANGTDTPTVAAGNRIMWKASLRPRGIAEDTDYGLGIGFFSSSGKFSAEGNIMSLLCNDNFADFTSLYGYDYTFNMLFFNCTGLTSAENLILPATTLVEGCFMGMFQNCTSLTTAPSLPATTLASYCYSSMFQGCTSLTTTPSTLPATTLANYCYSSMFRGCINLLVAPTLPAPILVEGCYSNMFCNARNLCVIRCLATDINASNCTYDWVASNSAVWGYFYKAPGMSSWTLGASGIPSSAWTIRDYTQ